MPDWLKPGLWGAVLGATAIAIVGFTQLGWTTEGTAQQMAQERADAATVAALVPFCVAKAQHDPDHASLARLQAEGSSYTRSDLVMKAGWATVGGNAAPDSALASACADKLHGASTG